MPSSSPASRSSSCTSTRTIPVRSSSISSFEEDEPPDKRSKLEQRMTNEVSPTATDEDNISTQVSSTTQSLNHYFTQEEEIEEEEEYESDSSSDFSHFSVEYTPTTPRSQRSDISVVEDEPEEGSPSLLQGEEEHEDAVLTLSQLHSAPTQICPGAVPRIQSQIPFSQAPSVLNDEEWAVVNALENDNASPGEGENVSSQDSLALNDEECAALDALEVEAGRQVDPNPEVRDPGSGPEPEQSESEPSMDSIALDEHECALIQQLEDQHAAFNDEDDSLLGRVDLNSNPSPNQESMCSSLELGESEQKALDNLEKETVANQEVQKHSDPNKEKQAGTQKTFQSSDDSILREVSLSSQVPTTSRVPRTSTPLINSDQAVFSERGDEVLAGIPVDLNDYPVEAKCDEKPKSDCPDPDPDFSESDEDDEILARIDMEQLPPTPNPAQEDSEQTDGESQKQKGEQPCSSKKIKLTRRESNSNFGDDEDDIELYEIAAAVEAGEQVPVLFDLEENVKDVYTK